MSKESISQDYLEEMKRKTKDYRPPASRTALTIGAEPGNINMAIVRRLRRDGFTSCYERPENFDVTMANTVARLFEMYESADTLVLGQATNSLNWIEDQNPIKIYQQVDAILTASILCTAEFVRRTINKPYLKHIVFIGSMAYRTTLNASAPYCAAKAGLAHFARCTGWELTPKGYRVFCVHPSNTQETPMTERTIEGIARYRGVTREEAEQYWGALNLMPEWLQKDDIAEVVSWLVSGKTGPQFMTGTQIELSGGQR